MPTEPVIQVDNVRVRYQDVNVLNDVSFSVTAGDYVGIVGPNGSGKTSLIKALLGLVEPVQGAVRFFGSELSRFNAWQRIGYLPQKVSFFDPRFPATVSEVIGFGRLSLKRFPKRLTPADAAEITAIARVLEITSLLERPVGKLSGGQQQRVLLARALVHHPEILILDEPTVALDPGARDNFYALVKRLNKEQKLTVMLVSHDVGTIGNYVSKLLYLDHTVIFYGGLEDFCKSTTMTAYFGEVSQHVICHRH